jgi:hypothetical protein
MQQRRRHPVIAAGLAAAVLVRAWAAAPALADEASCYQDIGVYTTALLEAHGALLNRCLRLRNYDHCPLVEAHVQEAQGDLARRLTSPSNACARAVDGDGVPISRFGPPVCPDAGTGCDAAVPAITDLDELTDCLTCLYLGWADDYRADLTLPTATPTNNNERRCLRATVSATTKATRQGKRDVTACARGATKPFDCPADDGAGTKYARALDVIVKKAGKCRDAGGAVGAVSGVSADLCGGVSTTAELAACLRALSRCAVCTDANAIYEQSQDCNAFSGIPCP